MSKIVLISNSPRRKELLETIGVSFRVGQNSYEENIDINLPPEEFVIQSALEKIKHSSIGKEGEILLTADTIVYFNERIIGKPQNMEEAFSFIKDMAGNYHEVYTGLALKDVSKQKYVTGFSKTRVHFVELSDAEIKSYLSAISPLDKAGAYAIQGKGGLIVSKVEGCFYNVMGLPLEKLGSLLKELGVNLLVK